MVTNYSVFLYKSQFLQPSLIPVMIEMSTDRTGLPDSPATFTALIVGCGYLGQRIARLWVRRGLKVYALTRSQSKADVLSEAGICPVVGNLADRRSLGELPAADVIVWAVGFERSAGTARESVWIDGLANIIGSLNATSAPRRFLYVSSTGVYGDAAGEVVSESTAPNPITEGGIVGWQAEQKLRQLAEQRMPKMEVVVLRMAGIYGPERLLRRTADLKAGVPISAAPDDWLNLIHVEDAARMVDIAASAVVFPPLINVVNKGTLSRRQYYSRLSQLVGGPPPVFGDATTASSRTGSGNKRVISELRDSLAAEFLYDDVSSGLRQAVEESSKSV